MASTRLKMTIWKYSPTTDDSEASMERLHRVQWPIVDKNACFDPNMISIIQWEKNLYYFKVVNQLGDNSKADIILQMYRFDMVKEKESLVREFTYEWNISAENQEIEKEKQLEKEMSKFSVNSKTNMDNITEAVNNEDKESLDCSIHSVQL